MTGEYGPKSRCKGTNVCTTPLAEHNLREVGGKMGWRGLCHTTPIHPIERTRQRGRKVSAYPPSISLCKMLFHTHFNFFESSQHNEAKKSAPAAGKKMAKYAPHFLPPDNSDECKANQAGL